MTKETDIKPVIDVATDIDIARIKAGDDVQIDCSATNAKEARAIFLEHFLRKKRFIKGMEALPDDKVWMMYRIFCKWLKWSLEQMEMARQIKKG